VAVSSALSDENDSVLESSKPTRSCVSARLIAAEFFLKKLRSRKSTWRKLSFSTAYAAIDG
jgi:hypothetical protein